MKIRSDHVTNSSSTSFVLIEKENLSEDSFCDLLGIGKDSILRAMAEAFYADVIENRQSVETFCRGYLDDNRRVEEVVAEECGKRAAERVMTAIDDGQEVYMGCFASDKGATEVFLCLDSFEVENEKLYLNAENCVW